MSEHDHPFQPGVEVVLVDWHGDGHRVTKGRVEKVHKNGRFTIEGNAQQYRAVFDSSANEWRGNKTCKSYYHRTAYLPSPKWEAKAKLGADAAKLRAVLNEIDATTRYDLHRSAATPDVIAAAQALLAAIRAAKEGPANADAA